MKAKKCLCTVCHFFDKTPDIILYKTKSENFFLRKMHKRKEKSRKYAHSSFNISDLKPFYAKKRHRVRTHQNPTHFCRWMFFALSHFLNNTQETILTYFFSFSTLASIKKKVWIFHAFSVEIYRLKKRLEKKKAVLKPLKCSTSGLPILLFFDIMFSILFWVKKRLSVTMSIYWDLV